jgi:hypothetical protein
LRVPLLVRSREDLSAGLASSYRRCGSRPTLCRRDASRVTIGEPNVPLGRDVLLIWRRAQLEQCAPNCWAFLKDVFGHALSQCLQ